MFKKFLGGMLPDPLDAQALSGLWNVWPLATYFTATGDNLHATAASKLNDSPELNG